MQGKQSVVVSSQSSQLIKSAFTFRLAGRAVELSSVSTHSTSYFEDKIQYERRGRDYSELRWGQHEVTAAEALLFRYVHTPKTLTCFPQLNDQTYFLNWTKCLKLDTDWRNLGFILQLVYDNPFSVRHCNTIPIHLSIKLTRSPYFLLTSSSVSFSVSPTLNSTHNRKKFGFEKFVADIFVYKAKVAQNLFFVNLQKFEPNCTIALIVVYFFEVWPYWPYLINSFKCLIINKIKNRIGKHLNQYTQNIQWRFVFYAYDFLFPLLHCFCFYGFSKLFLCSLID